MTTNSIDFVFCHTSGFRPEQFEQLATSLDGFLWNNLAVTNGQKSYAFKNQLANLEWALIRHTVDHLVNHCGFTLVTVPDVIPTRIVKGCGFPVEGARTQVFHIDDGRESPKPEEKMCLSGTGEMGIAGLLEKTTVSAAELPLKLATVSRCYRAEVSGLKEEKGLYRVHQFTKVEMFCVGRSSDALVDDIMKVSHM